MRQIFAVMKKEMWHILRDRRTLSFILFIPAFELMLYGWAIKVDVKHIRMAVLNEEIAGLFLKVLDDEFHGYFREAGRRPGSPQLAWADYYLNSLPQDPNNTLFLLARKFFSGKFVYRAGRLAAHEAVFY